MARPKKEGMDYFPHDTDASNDEKIEALRSLFGNDGYAFYFIILERVYRTKSAELDVSKPVLFASLAGKLLVSQDKLREMLEASFDLELLDREAFEKDGKITSSGIKKRFEEVENVRNKWRKRKEKQEDSEVFPVENKVENSGENVGVTPQSKVKESKVNKTKENNLKPIVPFGDIVDYLNQKTGQKYRSTTKATRSHINARWNEGYRLDDFKTVIDKKALEWLKNPNMAQYLRPETLFGNKFENYLNQPVKPFLIEGGQVDGRNESSATNGTGKTHKPGGLTARFAQGI